MIVTATDAPTIQVEQFKDLWAELLPLAEAHYAEVTEFKDVTFDCKRETYEQLDKINALRMYTLRLDGRLIGYSSMILCEQVHTGQLSAREDAIYVIPECRGSGYRLIRYVDEALRNEGVRIIYRTTKERHDHGRLLSHLGYTLLDLTYAKDLNHA